MPDLPYQRTTEERDIYWFIDTVLVSDIERVISSGGAYLAFGLIAQAIETLGALLDERDINDHEPGVCRDRFEDTLRGPFKQVDARYAKYASDSTPYGLYTHLRCGMTHVLRPQARLLLTARSDAKPIGLRHLETHELDGQTFLVLVIEDFFEHLKEVCRRCKHLLKKKTHAKLKLGYLTLHTFTFSTDPSSLSLQTASASCVFTAQQDK